jgi:glutamine cyclotransferase
MIKYWLALSCILLVYGCGVYLEHPQVGNNAQWKLICDSDTVIYRMSRKNLVIDSVINNITGEVSHCDQSQQYLLPATSLEPGINEVSLTFYCKGIKKRSYERLYLVSDSEPIRVEVDHYQLLQHDVAAFTQGLLWKNDVIYESTGLLGESSLRIINDDNGDVLKKIDLDKHIFAEGVTADGDTLLMLTWKDGLLYQFSTELEQLGLYPFNKEGWGITRLDDGRLVSSDGTNGLHFLSPDYKVDSTLCVYNHRGPVSHLNELEYIEGNVWANVLGSDNIVVIQPGNGKVEMEINVSACIDRRRYPQAGVLNGIAYNKRDNVVYLTGKNWPYIIVWQPDFFD